MLPHAMRRRSRSTRTSVTASSTEASVVKTTMALGIENRRRGKSAEGAGKALKVLTARLSRWEQLLTGSTSRPALFQRSQRFPSALALLTLESRPPAYDLSPAMGEEALIVRGAREHNLQNIDVTIPRDRLTVITGLSGSGKSSLAFDTIYAEGQRRYVESLSAYARQFLGLMEKPDVDAIEGLSPAISIEQKTAGHNPRSTVGTVTEIYDYLRLLYARAGTPHCPNCGRPVERQSAGQIAGSILTWPVDTKIEVLAPLVRGRKGEFKELFETARKQGFVRAYVDGDLVEIANPPKLNRKLNHSISVVVDRLVVRAEDRARLADSVETALKLSDGLIEVTRQDDRSTHLFSEKYGCPVCGISLPELEPRHFSFNSPFGACPDCGGLGVRREVSEELMLGDPSISILEGVILPWGEPDGYLRKVILPGLAKQFQFSLNMPWGQLSQHSRDVMLYGSGGRRGGKTHDV